MSRFARSIHIEATPPDVWKALVDVEAWPAWASQFKRIELLDAALLGRGSRVRIQPKGMLAATWRVTEYEEGRSFTWESSLAPGVRVQGGHVLSADSAGTNAEFWLDASGLLGSLLAPVLRRTVFSRNTRSATEGLKRYLASDQLIQGQRRALRYSGLAFRPEPGHVRMPSFTVTVSPLASPSAWRTASLIGTT